jgi:preprotein translocase subunit SecG
VFIGLLYLLWMLSSLVIIFLVLIQRGKGGGLAGAFGGAGGSSAFGTKAGDVFTKVTMYVAGAWIALSMVLVILSNRERTSDWDKFGSAGAQQAPISKGAAKPGKSDKAAGTKTAPELDPPPTDVVPPRIPEPILAPEKPVNPGDPLPPLPPPVKKTKTP